ncbi:hypothetical protein SUGI_0135130 [Cryptomeria japonica]|nr:hypothetical protein SUGI_0135130 [Cryptomeria japonica]
MADYDEGETEKEGKKSGSGDPVGHFVGKSEVEHWKRNQRKGAEDSGAKNKEWKDIGGYYCDAWTEKDKNITIRLAVRALYSPTSISAQIQTERQKRLVSPRREGTLVTSHAERRFRWGLCLD